MRYMYSYSGNHKNPAFPFSSFVIYLIYLNEWQKQGRWRRQRRSKLWLCRSAYIQMILFYFIWISLLVSPSRHNATHKLLDIFFCNVGFYYNKIQYKGIFVGRTKNKNKWNKNDDHGTDAFSCLSIFGVFFLCASNFGLLPEWILLKREEGKNADQLCTQQ